MTTKIDLTNIADTALTTLTGPKVTTIVYPGDDTATDTVGGAVINLTGNGFQSGCSVLVASTASSVVSFISATQISFVAPALAAGTYVIYVINPDGGTAISIPGISYSGTPNWTTAAGTLGTAYETGAISATLAATGDAPISYSLTTGTLPPGSTLNSNGTLSGTAQATASATTYSFTIKASDAQNQDTNRAFSITINPDVVTFNTPTDSTTYNVSKDAAIANVAMSATSAAGVNVTYTADTLPTGLSISGANIAGTPTVVASTTTVLTATSTSTRTATRTINWVVSIAIDTFFKNTVLLLNGETSVTPFISDASTNNLALTINGDTKATRFSPYTAAYYSEVISANNSTTIPNNAAFQFGTGDFTVEFWVKAPSQAGAIVAQATASSPNWGILATSGNLYWQSGFQAVSLLYFAFAFTGEWQHIAYARSSGTLKCYVNGVLGGSIADSTNYTGTGTLTFSPSGYGLFAGSIADFRIVKGTAVYTAAFSPPTAPLTAIAGTSLLISSASPTIVDSSPNNFTITKGTMTVVASAPYAPPPNTTVYGSGYFDGTGDLLSISANSALALGSGDFTVETWFYLTSSNSTQCLIDFRSTPASTTGFFVGIVTSGYIQVWNNNNVIYYNAGITISRWYHLAIVRSSGTITAYLDGTPVATISNSTNFTENVCRIGRSVSDLEIITGYISDVRVVKGTAVYTTAFTPPTTPLTAVANTSLLSLQYNGGATNSGFIDNSNFNNVITRFGNTSQGTFSPYSQTGWSSYFDGSTGFLSIPSTSAFSIATTTTPFTVEAWVYRTASGGCVFSESFTGSGTIALVVLFDNGTVNTPTGDLLTLAYYTGSTWVKQAASSSSVALNTWVHIACVFTGSTTKIFVNGTDVTAAGALTTWASTGIAGDAWYVGRRWDTASPAYFPGYISNLRYVVGTAVYTSAFTPPTTPLTAVTNTQLLTCQSNRFIDNSPNNFTLTKNGDTSVQAFSPFGSTSEATPISYSNYFGGSGNYLTIPTNAAFQFGTGDFTIEAWVYLSSGTTGTIFDNRTSVSSLHPVLYFTSATTINYYAGSTRIVSGSYTFLNRWVHVALCRASGSTKLFFDGVQTGSTYADTNNFSTSGNPAIGSAYNSGGSNILNGGNISNLRVVKGTALYTSAFTPSTTPLTAIANTSLLTCQSTTMIDNSANRFTITAFGNTVPRQSNPFGYTAQSSASYTPSLHGGSAYFDGAGDYLTLPSSSNFAFGTGNFSVEFWVYPTVNVRQDWLDFTDGTNRMLIYYNGTNIVHYILPTVAGAITGSAPIFNTWNHIAISRSSGSTRMFINGVQSGSTYTDSKSYPIVNLTIGKDNAGSTHITGYMSDVKVTKGGTGLYTSNFIPPTQALTSPATTPASLLLNFTNGGIIDQHSSNVLETVGNAQLSTSVKKYNNASIYFDGTGDYLTIPSSSNLSFGTGDFTIEFWIRPITQAATYPGLFGNQTFTANSFVGYERHGTYPTKFSVFCYNYSSAGAMLVSTTSVSPDTWYHVAITRSGSNFRLFVNGTVEATATFAGSVDGGVPLRYIGIDYTATNTFAGYMDDFRITKGVARYTSNFTAPTSAFITK